MFQWTGQVPRAISIATSAWNSVSRNAAYWLLLCIRDGSGFDLGPSMINLETKDAKVKRKNITWRCVWSCWPQAVVQHLRVWFSVGCVTTEVLPN
jgi:hypothetical protein